MTTHSCFDTHSLPREDSLYALVFKYLKYCVFNKSFKKQQKSLKQKYRKTSLDFKVATMSLKKKKCNYTVRHTSEKLLVLAAATEETRRTHRKGCSLLHFEIQDQ